MEDTQDKSKIGMKNESIDLLTSLMAGKSSLKQNYGRKMSTTNTQSTNIKGLAKLNTGLGKQFSKGTLADLLE
jgi:hypothetical protein